MMVDSRVMDERVCAQECTADDRLGSALEELALSLAEVAPLVRAVGVGMRVVCPVVAYMAADARVQGLFDRLTARLGLPRLTLCAATDAEDLTAPEIAVGGRLTLTSLSALTVAAGAPARVPDHALDRAVAAARARQPAATTIHREDGAVLYAYAAGDPDRPAVVVALPCGLPSGIARRWIDRLAASFHVLTWESRCLFDTGIDTGGTGDADRFDGYGHDLAAQAGDLVAVLEHFGVTHAHAMGLCSGAPIVLAAASCPRVNSISLWHGDYELGDDAAKSTHQQDVQLLMAMAGRSRHSATGFQRMFRRASTLEKLPVEFAPFLIYPYVTAELLYRYARLNGAIMTTDCRPLVSAVHQQALVVTSVADTTAHPAGSRYAAAHMRRARLWTRPSGDHLSVFAAEPELVELARAFVIDTLASAFTGEENP